jgi:hypothetical protein
MNAGEQTENSVDDSTKQHSYTLWVTDSGSQVHNGLKSFYHHMASTKDSASFLSETNLQLFFYPCMFS